MASILRLVSNDDEQPTTSDSDSPAAATSKLRFASSDPDEMSDSFDLVDQLVNHKDRYGGAEWVAIQSLPGYLRTCIDRVRAACEEATEKKVSPSLAATVSACCVYGLGVIAAHQDVINTLRAKHRLLTSHTIPSADQEELAGFLRSFSLSHADMTTSGTRRQSVTVSNSIKMELAELADKLGISTSALVVRCIEITMAGQESMLEERKRDLERSVQAFFRRISIRAKVVNSWLDVIDR